MPVITFPDGVRRGGRTSTARIHGVKGERMKGRGGDRIYTIYI